MTTLTDHTPTKTNRWLPAATLGAAALAWYFTLALIVVSQVFPLVVGWSPTVITSGSMEPVIHAGDVVITEPSDGMSLAPGAIITFRSAADPDELITHRIEAVASDGTYITRGDNNRRPDSTPVAPRDVVGEGRLVVPYAGLPLLWISRGEIGYFVAFVMLLVFAKAYMTWAETRAARAERGEDVAEQEARPALRAAAVAGRLALPVLAVLLVVS